MRNSILRKVGRCYPEGQCGTANIVQNYTLHNKVYRPEDSILLRSLGMFGAKMLQGGYITVVPNVKDKQPLYRDKFEITYQSAATGGRGATECGKFDATGKVDIVTNKCIHVFFMYMEAEICYNSLIGSFQQGLLQAGAQNVELNTSLNNRILDAFVENSNKQTDYLIWNGDYKSPNGYIAHYDGLVKKIVQAIGSNQNQQHELTVSTPIVAGDSIRGNFGGVDVEVPFDTDVDTTMGNLATLIASYVHPTTGQPLVTVCYAANVMCIISNNDNYPVEFNLQVVLTAGTDDCLDNIPGTGVLDTAELVPYAAVDKPLAVAYNPISPNNAIQELTKIYMKVAQEKAELLRDPDFVIHTSSQVYHSIVAANVQLTQRFAGIDGTPSAPTPYGLRIVEQPALEGHIIVGTTKSNIFFGTDLLSDMQNTEQWIDRDCQTVKFRHAVRQGVQIDRFSWTVSNLDCFTGNFKAAQPEVCNLLGDSFDPDAGCAC